MNTRPLVRLFLPLGAALTLCLAACSSVSVPSPVGDQPHVLNPADWAGTWLTPDGKALSVFVTDASKGELKVVWLETNDGETVLKSHKVHLRESAGWLLASVQNNPEDKTQPYLWGRLKIEHDHVVIWEPDVPGFRALVREGKLKGTLTGSDSGNVELEQIPAETLAALASGAFGVPFKWDSPFVLRRAGR